MTIGILVPGVQRKWNEIQNTPRDIEVGEVTTAQSAGVGWATITTTWDGSPRTASFTAYVDLDGSKPMKLLDVDCGVEG